MNRLNLPRRSAIAGYTALVLAFSVSIGAADAATASPTHAATTSADRCYMIGNVCDWTGPVLQ